MVQDYDRLAEDIFNYLSAKLPNMDKATEMEVSEYIGNRVSRFVQSALLDRDRQWDKTMRSQQRYFNKEVDRLYRKHRGEQ